MIPLARRALLAAARRLERLARTRHADPTTAHLAHADMTLRDWLLRHQDEIVFRSCRWMGVPTWKNALDAWIYQEILHEVRPDAVVEIGCRHGGSTLYLAHLLDLLGGDGIVVSIDVDRSVWQASHPRFRVLTGPCESPAIVEETRRLCAGKRTLVIHDADHRAPSVLRDLRLYAPLVAAGSYLIVEDGIVDSFAAHEPLGIGEPGPVPAIREFLAEHPEFVPDRSRERYLLTYNPLGYLRRER